MASRPSCLTEELRCALPHHPTLSRRWDVGAMWSGSSGGGAATLDKCGSGPSMMTGGPKGIRIPSSPTRRHAWSGRRAWWKVEWRLDSLSMPS
jgi:hypothetical protein